MLPLGKAMGDCSEPVWEHTEQLYLLEVLVDQVLLELKDTWYSLEDPVMELVGKVCFLDLPAMEVQPNELFSSRKQKSGDETPRIPGLPEDWDVTFAYELPDFKLFPQYKVTIDVAHPVNGKTYVVSLHVPKIAVEADEGIRYIYTALERKVNPELMATLRKQIKEALEKEKDKQDCEKPIVFASGKSCLFQMTPYELIKSLERFPFYVLIYRQGVVEGVPVRHLLGRVKLMMKEPFTKAVTAAEGAESLPVSAHVEKIYTMENVFGEKTGTMALFVRLSCFGSSMGRPLAQQSAADLPTDQEKANTVVLPAMVAEERDLVVNGDRCGGWKSSEDRVPITWRRAEDVRPEGFRPLLAELAEALREMPPPPPRTKPPSDPWLGVTGLERCRPGVQPPCYRRPGDPPIPPCKQQAEAQLRREQLSKPVQTVPIPKVARLPPDSPYIDNNPKLN